MKNRGLIAALVAVSILVTASGCSVKKSKDEIKSFVTDLNGFTFSDYADDKTEYTAALKQEDAAALAEYQETASNRFLTLYYSEKTAGIAVFDKRSAKVWYSNSPKVDSDEIIDKDSKNLFKSQLLIEYLDGQNFKILDSYTASVLKNKVTFEKNKDGISVTYRFLDNKSAGISQSDKTELNKELFKVTLVYTLEEESLIASIPASQITYDAKLPPLNITVLPHFGGSDAKTDGYLLVPDGSGALIRFDSSKFTKTSYVGNVYGFDKTLELKTEPAKSQYVSLPVFGVKEGQNSFLTVIEDGEAFSRINANRGGLYSSFHEVYASFALHSYQNVSIGSMENASKLIAIQDVPYQGSLRLRYSFLKSGSGDYVGMGSYYRNYLIKRYGLEKMKAKENIPLNLELIGTIDKLKSFLGIKYMGMEKLTTTGQAIEILKELKESKIQEINLKYSGWANGGLKQDFPAKIKAESAVGGDSGIKKLSRFAGDNGIGFYPALDILTTPVNSSGFHKYEMAARQIDQREGKSYTYDYVTKKGTDYTSILSPLVLGSLLDNLNSSFQKYKVNTIAINDIANEVYADYTKGKPVDRQSTVNIYSRLLKEKLSGYSSLMLDGNYSFAAPAADIMLNVPLSGSNYDVTDCSVPFFQIVFHGYLTYSGTPLNSSFDFDTDFLRSIEYGAVPYYKLMYAEGSAIKNTEYSEFCSNNYEIWKEELIESYQKANTALSKVQNETIIGHSEISAGVFRTDYSNGISVYVNYTEKDAVAGSVTIPAKGFQTAGEVAQ